MLPRLAFFAIITQSEFFLYDFRSRGFKLPFRGRVHPCVSPMQLITSRISESISCWFSAESSFRKHVRFESSGSMIPTSFSSFIVLVSSSKCRSVNPLPTWCLPVVQTSGWAGPRNYHKRHSEEKRQKVLSKHDIGFCPCRKRLKKEENLNDHAPKWRYVYRPIMGITTWKIGALDAVYVSRVSTDLHFTF